MKYVFSFGIAEQVSNEHFSMAGLGTLADNTKLGGVVDTPKGCSTIEKDLDRLKSWTGKNFMRFNKSNC